VRCGQREVVLPSPTETESLGRSQEHAAQIHANVAAARHRLQRRYHHQCHVHSSNVPSRLCMGAEGCSVLAFATQYAMTRLGGMTWDSSTRAAAAEDLYPMLQ
jgi:hypothetical protein